MLSGPPVSGNTFISCSRWTVYQWGSKTRNTHGDSMQAITFSHNASPFHKISFCSYHESDLLHRFLFRVCLCSGRAGASTGPPCFGAGGKNGTNTPLKHWALRRRSEQKTNKHIKDVASLSVGSLAVPIGRLAPGEARCRTTKHRNIKIDMLLGLGVHCRTRGKQNIKT